MVCKNVARILPQHIANAEADKGTHPPHLWMPRSDKRQGEILSLQIRTQESLLAACCFSVLYFVLLCSATLGVGDFRAGGLKSRTFRTAFRSSFMSTLDSALWGTVRDMHLHHSPAKHWRCFGNPGSGFADSVSPIATTITQPAFSPQICWQILAYCIDASSIRRPYSLLTHKDLMRRLQQMLQ